MSTKIKQNQRLTLLWGAVLLLFCLSFLSVSTVDATAGAKEKAVNWMILKPSETYTLAKISNNLKGFIVDPLAALIGSLVVLYIVIAGVRYVMAKGPEEAQAAKGALFNALIGLCIVAAAWGIFSLVAWFAGEIFK